MRPEAPIHRGPLVERQRFGAPLGGDPGLVQRSENLFSGHRYAARSKPTGQPVPKLLARVQKAGLDHPHQPAHIVNRNSRLGPYSQAQNSRIDLRHGHKAGRIDTGNDLWFGIELHRMGQNAQVARSRSDALCNLPLHQNDDQYRPVPGFQQMPQYRRCNRVR